VLPVCAEALVLRVVGFTSAFGLVAQFTGPSPFGMFHDLRWVLVYHDFWWSFVGESVAAIVVRGLLATGLMVLAWPEEITRPSWWPLLRINLAFTTL